MLRYRNDGLKQLENAANSMFTAITRKDGFWSSGQQFRLSVTRSGVLQRSARKRPKLTPRSTVCFGWCSPVDGASGSTAPSWWTASPLRTTRCLRGSEPVQLAIQWLGESTGAHSRIPLRLPSLRQPAERALLCGVLRAATTRVAEYGILRYPLTTLRYESGRIQRSSPL